MVRAVMVATPAIRREANRFLLLLGSLRSRPSLAERPTRGVRAVGEVRLGRGPTVHVRALSLHGDAGLRLGLAPFLPAAPGPSRDAAASAHDLGPANPAVAYHGHRVRHDQDVRATPPAAAWTALVAPPAHRDPPLAGA